MDATVGADVIRQSGQVGADQLRQHPVLQQQVWQLVQVPQGFEHAGVGRWTRLGLADHRQAEFGEQQFADLFRTRGIERTACMFADAGGDLGEVLFQMPLGRREGLAVHQQPGVLYMPEAGGDRDLLRTVDLEQVVLGEFGFEHLRQTPATLRILAGILRHVHHRHVGHGLTVGEIDHLSGGDLLLIEERFRQVVDAMAFTCRVQQPARQHGVAVDAVHRDAMSCEHAHIVFGVLSDLLHGRVGEQRREERLGRIPRHQGVVESTDRQVDCRTCIGDSTRHADTDQIGGQRIETGGLGIEGEPSGPADVGDVGGQLGEREDAVGCIRGAGRLGLRREEPRPTEVELGECRFVTTESPVDAVGIQRR